MSKRGPGSTGAAVSMRGAGRATADPDVLGELEARLRELIADGPALNRACRAVRTAMLEIALLEGEDLRQSAGARLISEIIHSLWLDAPLDPRSGVKLMDAIERSTGIPAVCIGSEVLSHPAVLHLPADLAIGTHLEMLLAVSGARHVSLWLIDSRGRISCRARAGLTRSPGGARRLATSLLHGHAPAIETDPSLVAAPVLRGHQTCAAVVAHSGRPQAQRSRVFVKRSAEMLALMLERDAILSRGARTEQAMVAGTERRLARLGLDLHDGPLQAVIAAARDLEACRGHLDDAISVEVERRRVGGWLDDIEHRLEEVEAELRGFSASLGSYGFLQRPLPEALAEIVHAFGQRSRIGVTIEIQGELGDLTQSQQIALARIVQEALNNIQAHSGATRASIVVSATREHVRAEVKDDGCGFDMERTLVKAARSGRLGLLGMDERVRLLGGTFRMRSRVGGPTTLTVVLPRWTPATHFTDDGDSGDGFRAGHPFSS